MLDRAARIRAARIRAGRAAAFGAVLVVGLLLGVGSARLMAPRPEGPPLSVGGTGRLLADQARAAAQERASAAPRRALPPAPPAARGAEQAVGGFLAAEAGGDYTESFTFLSRADRRRFDAPAGWVAAHADLLPIRGFRLVGTERTRRGARVHSVLRLRGGLDEVTGLVPGRAAATWTVVREAGGWRVAFDRTVVRPRWPADALAPDAVRQWLHGRAPCAPGAADRLYGDVSRAASLCGASTQAAALAGPARPLVDDTDAQPFVAAYGVDATQRLRAVEVTGPARLRVVVAPAGGGWQVVGLLRARP